MREIIKELNKIVFHDIPVESIKVISDPEKIVVISFFLYQEELKNYQNIELIFKGIEEFEMDNIILDLESDIEISNFNYELKEKFDCNITFLLGFGKPTFEMKIKCNEIKITVPNKV